MENQKRINIMSEWSEFNPLSQKSIRDDFNPDPSPFQSRILSYLDGGELVLASPSVAVDVITGKRISQTNCILTDGEYSWSGSLGHYIRKYNLRLPEEFENKILKVIQSERGEYQKPIKNTKE